MPESHGARLLTTRIIRCPDPNILRVEGHPNINEPARPYATSVAGPLRISQPCCGSLLNPARTGIERPLRHVRKVPNAEVTTDPQGRNNDDCTTYQGWLY